MSDRMVELFSTWFYIGKFPLAPGTLASFVGMLMYFLLAGHFVMYLVILTAITILGFFVTERMETILQRKDPGCVVIDEVAGVMLAFFLLPVTPAIALVTFFLFRAFDMFKIYPVNKLEAMEGSIGIMADDLLAGLYTCLIMHIAIRWAGIV